MNKKMALTDDEINSCTDKEVLYKEHDYTSDMIQFTLNFGKVFMFGYVIAIYFITNLALNNSQDLIKDIGILLSSFNLYSMFICLCLGGAIFQSVISFQSDIELKIYRKKLIMRIIEID